MAVTKRSEQAKTYPFTSWRDYTPMNTSLGTMLHNRTGSWRYIKPRYEDKVPACMNGCPAGNDIEGWIALLQRGDRQGAFWHLKREQPFPAVLGRVCFRFCQDACNRRELDSCVMINELERYVGDLVSRPVAHPDLPSYHGAELAVVGSGPAGMSAAYFGRLLGYKVTIFEALPEPGGILRVGIPSYRLPREIVAREFEGLKLMGIEVRTGTPVGDVPSLADLRRAYDYLFCATGVHESVKLGVPGEDEGDRVISGLRLLRRVAGGETVSLGREAVVIGGGNTAVDAARTAVRLGCRVTVVYRRTAREMPAHPDEVREAQEEGVRFRFLAAPEEIVLNDDGSVNRVVCCEMELGAPDESGRRRPVKKADTRFEMKADSVVTAIGEIADLGYLGGGVRVDGGVVTVGEGLCADGAEDGAGKVFAGGDIIDSPHTVVHAVAAGKRAAVAMDCDRRGLDTGEVLARLSVGNGTALSFSRFVGWEPVNPVRQSLKEVVDSSKIVYDYFEQVPPASGKIETPEARVAGFLPYTTTFDDELAAHEASRCMHCGRCTQCDNCLIFCPDISVLPRGGDRFGYTFDYDYCKGCGVCFTECPRNAITMIDEETPVEDM